MSRTYRNAPLSLTTKGRLALRDGAVVHAPCAWDRTLRHRRRQAAADPVLGRGPASPGQWAERARAHLVAMESVFGEVTHTQVCSCGQSHCDYDLARIGHERQAVRA
jgi:hypothetical protein